MSIAKVLQEWAKSSPNRYLITDTLTYEQARDKISRLASKIPEGGTVVHLMTNSVESILVYIAGFWAGAKVVALDPLTSAEDLRFILEDASPDLVLVDEEIQKKGKRR